MGKNTLGNNFVCAPGNSCCGNACASKESQCCKDPNTGYEFPLLKSTPCPASLLQTGSDGWSKMKMSSLRPNLSPLLQNVANNPGTRTCFNDQNNVPGNSCCGGTCVAPGGQCCMNTLGDNFPCGAGSTCCGNACAGEGSKCCTNKNGYKYPVTRDTKCSA